MTRITFCTVLSIAALAAAPSVGIAKHGAAGNGGHGGHPGHGSHVGHIGHHHHSLGFRPSSSFVNHAGAHGVRYHGNYPAAQPNYGLSHLHHGHWPRLGWRAPYRYGYYDRAFLGGVGYGFGAVPFAQASVQASPTQVNVQVVNEQPAPAYAPAPVIQPKVYEFPGSRRPASDPGPTVQGDGSTVSNTDTVTETDSSDVVDSDE